MRTYICLVVLLFGISCSQDDNLNVACDGIISFVEPFWKYDNIQTDFENVKVSSGLSDANLIINDRVLVSGIGEDGYQSLMAVDLNSGKELWQWNDVFYKERQDLFIDRPLFIENKINHVSGPRFYSINLSDGTTFHREESDYDNFTISFANIEDTIFMLADDLDTLENARTNIVWKVKMDGSFKEKFLYPDFTQTDFINATDYTILFHEALTTEVNGEKLLLIKGGIPIPGHESQAFLELYSLSQQKWIFRNVKAGRPSSNGATISFEVVDDKIYLMISSQIVCHDLWTGEEIWSRDFKYNLISTGFTISGDRLVTNNQFGQLHCVDIHTGRDIWKIEHDKSGPIRIVNGILYYSGAGTNQIHARRLSDGSEVWRLDPSRYDGAEDFKPDIYAVEGKNGEKGKIIVQTYGHAYCLEAYQ